MWLTENPWPPMFLCGVVAALCVITWYQRQQARYLGGALLALVLAGAGWMIERMIVTAGEHIESAVYAMTSAFQERDLDRTLSHVSKQAPDVRALVGFGYNLVEVGDDMRVTDVQVKMSGKNTRATSRFRVNATVNSRVGHDFGHQPSRWETKWQLEGEEWRVIDIRELDPLTGEELNRITKYRHLVPRMAG